MNLYYFAVIGALSQAIMAQPTWAEDLLPTCDQAPVGVQCVEMRAAIGPWSLEERVPPVGSQNALVMTTESFQPVPGLFGREEPALLILSCIENTTQLEFAFGENFMSDIGDFGDVIYKVDDAAPVVLPADAAQDNGALGIYSGVESIPIIRELLGAERLFVSATSFTGRTMSATFSIEGLEGAVEPLRELCSW